MGTRTLTHREQNVKIVEGALSFHRLKTFAINVPGFVQPLFCACRAVSPENALTIDTAHKHLAESIVTAQNEWVRSMV